MTSREEILGLLQHIARPPDVLEEEWQELLLLEAPSILGLAMPGAEVLEEEARSIDGTSSFSVGMGSHIAPTSMEGYSPSSAGMPLERKGFNLLLPDGIVLDCHDPEHPSEAIALQALRDGWLWEEDLLCLTETLPANGDVWSCSFITGAFIHGASAGITVNSRRYPMVTCLLTSVLRSIAPDCWFTSAGISLNMQAGVHRGSNNAANIPNILIPASDFENGELWIEDGSGTQQMSGYMGRLISVERPFITFNPRLRHATSAWSGTRLVLIGYHVRNAELLTASHSLELRRLGFRPYIAR